MKLAGQEGRLMTSRLAVGAEKGEAEDGVRMTLGRRSWLEGAGAGMGEEGVSSRLGVELEHWFSEQREMSLRVLERPA